METPEEVAAAVLEGHCDDGLDCGSLCAKYGAARIRERDEAVRADERAKVLAGFTEVHTLAWDGDPSMSGAPHRCSTAAEVDLETARRALSTVGRRKPSPRIERRLVSPWQPVADEGGAS